MSKPVVRSVPNKAGELHGLLSDMKRAIEQLAKQQATQVSLTQSSRGASIIEEDDGPPEGSSPPPAPAPATVTAGPGIIFIEWTAPTYDGHAATQIFRGTSNDVSEAILIAQTEGALYVDSVGYNTQTYYYWIRFIDRWGRTGGYDTMAGTLVNNSLSVPELLDALTAAALDPSAPYRKISYRADLFYVASEGSDAPVFSVVTTPINNNGVLVPAGMYVESAFIKNGDITNAKIANLAVDDAKIASLSVGKLQAGIIGVGVYIQSQGYVAGSLGWRINAGGSAEFNNAVIRGQVFVGGGSLGGIQIFPTHVQSSNYSGTTGVGFKISSDGTLDLPGGSIRTQHLAVGMSSNLLTDSTWVDRAGYNGAVPTSWAFNTNESVYNVFVTSITNPTWIPDNVNGVVLWNNQPVHSGTVMQLYTDVAGLPGQRYEASVDSGAHRCSMDVELHWINSAGTLISVSADSAVINNSEKAGGKSISDYKRIGCFGIAPAGTVKVRMVCNKRGTNAGTTDSYGFLMRPFLGMASPQQLDFTPYNPTGQGVRVTPNGITTPSLAAISGVMGDLYAGTVRGGGYSAIYDWPANPGHSGFHLGPGGLLMGNARAGSPFGYFQFEAATGNLYMPGMNIINKVLQFYQANAINTDNIVTGAVTFAQVNQAWNEANIWLNVPAGSQYVVQLFATYHDTNYVTAQGVSNAGAIGMPRYRDLSGAVGNPKTDAQDIQADGDGSVFIWTPLGYKTSTDQAMLILGPGTHQLRASQWWPIAYWGGPVTLIMVAFKK